MYIYMGEHGKRLGWTVKVAATRLSDCCAERIAYHVGRVKFWEKERQEAESKLRSQGIKLQHFEVTGGQRMEASLDPSLAKRVGECESRIRSNQDSTNKFIAYRSFFKLCGDESLEVNADDVLYFNLEGADQGEE